ncbi:MAG: hypothetical protein M1828_001717 [Chrysothrix sp. TS-e1954]|nr:MAG: hypothetical protein M1828_001717 [Chrysothrix sp. TS-e1954]
MRTSSLLRALYPSFRIRHVEPTVQVLYATRPGSRRTPIGTNGSAFTQLHARPQLSKKPLLSAHVSALRYFRTLISYIDSQKSDNPLSQPLFASDERQALLQGSIRSLKAGDVGHAAFEIRKVRESYKRTTHPELGTEILHYVMTRLLLEVLAAHDGQGAISEEAKRLLLSVPKLDHKSKEMTVSYEDASHAKDHPMYTEMKIKVSHAWQKYYLYGPDQINPKEPKGGSQRAVSLAREAKELAAEIGKWNTWSRAIWNKVGRRIFWGLLEIISELLWALLIVIMVSIGVIIELLFNIIIAIFFH